MKEILKNKYVAMAIGTPICLLLVYLGAWVSGQYKVYVRDQNNWAIGKVVSRTNSGSSIEVEYYVDGVRYISEEATPGIEIYLGEYLMVQYDENNPSYSSVATEKNFFLMTDKTKTVTGTVHYIQEYINRSGTDVKACTVRYPYRNKTKTTTKSIPTEWELQKGDTVFVEYKIDNPNICIIKLEE